MKISFEATLVAEFGLLGPLRIEVFYLALRQGLKMVGCSR